MSSTKRMRSSRGRGASASPAFSNVAESPVPDVTTPSNMTPPAAPERQRPRRDPFAYDASPERPKRMTAPARPAPSSVPSSAKRGKGSVRSSASPAVPATPITPVDATPGPTPNRTPAGRSKKVAQISAFAGSSKSAGGAFAVPQGKQQGETRRSANKRSIASSSPISPPMKKLRSRAASTPTRIPTTPVKRTGTAPSAARSLNWHEPRVLKMVSAPSFYGVDNEEGMQERAFLVEDDGILIRNDVKETINSLEEEIEELKKRIEESESLIEKTDKKMKETEEDVKKHKDQVEKEKKLALDSLKGKEVSKKAASQLKKGSKAKGKATDEVEEGDDEDHGMFKGKDSEESINKEADRLTTEGAKKLKREVTKHEKAVQANRSQKAQLERLEEDLEEAQGGLETYGFDGKVVQVRGSNFSGYGEAGGEVRKTSATVLIPRVFEERKEVMGYYKEDKDGKRRKVKPNPGKTQKRAYRAVMNSVNQSWIEAADDKDFHKLLEDHKTELAPAPAVK